MTEVCQAVVKYQKHVGDHPCGMAASYLVNGKRLCTRHAGCEALAVAVRESRASALPYTQQPREVEIS